MQGLLDMEHTVRQSHQPRTWSVLGLVLQHFYQLLLKTYVFDALPSCPLCICDWVYAHAIIFVLCSMNALSEYQLTISLAVLQSRKFCSVGLACHHFLLHCSSPLISAASQPAHYSRPPIVSLALSLFLSFSVFILLSYFLCVSLFGLTPNT